MSVQRTFVQLSCQIGLRVRPRALAPACMTFATASRADLLHWYRTGADVEQRMPTLSAYLGHAHVNDTFWYLSATPELYTR